MYNRTPGWSLASRPFEMSTADYCSVIENVGKSELHVLNLRLRAHVFVRCLIPCSTLGRLLHDVSLPNTPVPHHTLRGKRGTYTE